MAPESQIRSHKFRGFWQNFAEKRSTLNAIFSKKEKDI